MLTKFQLSAQDEMGLHEGVINVFTDHFLKIILLTNQIYPFENSKYVDIHRS